LPLLVLTPYFFFIFLPRPPRSTLFPYTTLFRSFRCPQLGLPISEKVFESYLRRIGQSELVMSLRWQLGRRSHHTFLSCPLCRAVESIRSSRNRILSADILRSEEHTSELQSRVDLVC